MTKVKIIFLIFVLPILLLTAFASSLWFDKLKIHVPINIAKDCVSFVEWSCSDIGSDPQIEGYSNIEGKNVGSCSLRVLKTDKYENNIVLSLVLNNVYPGYGIEVNTVVENTGTIPIQFLDYSIEPSNLPLDVELIPPQTTYINPGDRTIYTLSLAVKQNADENTSYIFNITLLFGPPFTPGYTSFTSYKAHAYLGIRGCNKEEGRVSVESNGRMAKIIFDKFSGGWGWIGLVISNVGDSSTTIYKNQITVTTNRVVNQIEIFLYGPFQNPGNSGVWRNVDICKMTQNLNSYGNPFPGIEHYNIINLEANQKAILWIYIEGSSGPLTINVELS